MPLATPDAPEPAGLASSRALSPAGVEEELLELLRELRRELHPQRRAAAELTLDSSLERDVGLDSLGRVELAARIERAFGVSLSEQQFAAAETARDLLRALAAQAPAREAPRPEREMPPEADTVAVPTGARTLFDVVRWYTERQPERRHISFSPGDGEAETLSYAGLLARGETVAAGLQEAGIEAHDTVGIMLPSGLDYFAAFVGTLVAGAVPVPLYPPARRSQIEDHLRRQAGILATEVSSKARTCEAAGVPSASSKRTLYSWFELNGGSR